MEKCRKVWEKEGRSQGTREGMEEDTLPGATSKRKAWGAVGGFAKFSFTSSLLTPHSCVIIFFVLVSVCANYFCKTVNPNFFTI